MLSHVSARFRSFLEAALLGLRVPRVSWKGGRRPLSRRDRTLLRHRRQVERFRRSLNRRRLPRARRHTEISCMIKRYRKAIRMGL